VLVDAANEARVLTDKVLRLPHYPAPNGQKFREQEEAEPMLERSGQKKYPGRQQGAAGRSSGRAIHEARRRAGPSRSGDGLNPQQEGNPMRTLWSYLAVVAVAAAVAPAAHSSEGEAAEKAEALFKAKCSTCHAIERPKGKKKTPQGWEQTVMRMKNVNRAPLTDDEARAIIDYLAKEYGP
jgi:cytochrome c5